jgi:hypothetical protein
MSEYLKLNQVAARLHKSGRWLQDYLRQNPCDQTGKPFYRLAGRSRLFTEADITRIYESLPAPEEPA